MNRPMTTTSLKQIRKAARRQLKYKHTLLRETGIHGSDLPTKCLMIGNAGLVTGLKQENLLEMCLPYGTIANIMMLPAKSYCFVVFKDVADATNAYNSLHGKARLPTEEGGLVYMVYTEAVPEAPQEWAFNSKPPGLVLLEDFVSEGEEELLIHSVDWKDSAVNQSLKHRRVVHYGYEFRYDINNVDKKCPLLQKLPAQCDFFVNRVKESQSRLEFAPPNQLTVNQYQPGQGIPPHIDTHSAFEDPIFSLSLGSDVVMDFKQADGRAISVLLPRRSLLIMSGESRFAWSHGITPRTIDIVPLSEGGLTTKSRGIRTSFTFRTIRKDECNCQYQQYCDSYQRKVQEQTHASSSSCNDFARKLEAVHVHDVYEEIANHFSETRHKPWPNILDFVKSLDMGSILIDIGCGNGKYFGENMSIFELGCDRSFGLTKVCNARGFQVFNCNCLSLPLKDNIADGCISIAVIHHLASQERRLKALQEIIRILRPSGRALIYVWAKDQERHKTKSSYLKQDRKNRKAESSDPAENPPTNQCGASSLLPIHTNRTQFKHQDVLVPWKNKPSKALDGKVGSSSADQVAVSSGEEAPTFLRYYHVFDEGELETLCSASEGAKVIKSFYDQGNWCVVIEKL